VGRSARSRYINSADALSRRDGSTRDHRAERVRPALAKLIALLVFSLGVWAVIWFALSALRPALL
jgi:hypothetical protein